MQEMGTDPIIPTNSQVALHFLRKKNWYGPHPLEQQWHTLIPTPSRGGIWLQKYENSLKVCFETVIIKSIECKY